MIEQFALWFFGPTHGPAMAFFLTFVCGCVGTVVIGGLLIFAAVVTAHLTNKHVLEAK